MTLTIAPTMSCNFRCSYCFEKNQYHDIPMSEATILKLIDFVASRIKSLKKLTVLWFGGEPLLALDIIKTITHRLIDLCSKNNVIYAAGMSTNGYYLTSETSRLLRSYSINNLSITIDGVKAVHDFRRPLIDGGALSIQL